MTTVWLRCLLLSILIQVIYAGTGWTQETKTLTSGVNVESDRVLSSEQVAELLIRPECFGSPGDTSRPYIIKDYMIPSNGISLSAQLYLPSETGKWPLVILVPGGFNETELIMESPRYYAPRLARCGIAALVCYKRGTGPSGGVYAEATEDDFIDDVVNVAKKLARDPHIDSTKIGAMGGSGGGLVAPLAAARYPKISFVVSSSAPIMSGEEHGNYNIEYALRYRGYADSLVQMVMPLWRRHHAAWAKSDTAELKAVAAQITEMRKHIDPLALPTPYQEVFADSNLIFLWPRFRSASRDYMSELKHMRAKWLCIYGEKDMVVSVQSSISNIPWLMKESGNDNYSIVVLPGVDHSFFNPETREQVPVIRIIVNWLTGSVLRR
ncbi:MAG: alpha/beta fold hydrolase [candidate division Zixibacteria bacterium]|nr:alpha/beta fold hydrolase [candidate division Zixibacteria bacterium]